MGPTYCSGGSGSRGSRFGGSLVVDDVAAGTAGEVYRLGLLLDGGVLGRRRAPVAVAVGVTVVGVGGRLLHQAGAIHVDGAVRRLNTALNR